ncbi:Cell polarity protein [Lachnellula subtilissima]|uniref:Cell polarity protein n=1 Tax=Lachnellula subtilissima TaxID=602034 RepID=A0A8H8UA77_9HELO|nr:Cell polarity protein [Lachnellula subtilissima]
MSMQTAGDIPLQVTSENASSERRITPSWTIGQLKAKLEPVTGIPPLSQKLVLNLGSQQSVSMEAADEENTQLCVFPLAPYAEIHALAPTTPTRPVCKNTNSRRPSTKRKPTACLPGKKANKLGRFDPDAPSLEQAKLLALENEIKERGIAVGKRCRVGGEDAKRGVVMYVGDVEEIPGQTGAWVGVKLDEPVGRNDGSLKGKRYWGKEGDAKFGVFVRPERVEIGEWPVIDDLEDMEEI